jgi:hypothetical protein
MTYRHPDRTSFYHPYNFLLSPSQSERLYLAEIEIARTSGKANYLKDDSGNSLTYELLAWDSEFFGRPIYKVHFLSLAPNSSTTHIEALLDKLFLSLHKPNWEIYFFVEVASEDLEVLETVSRRGWKLIETRLTFFNADISVIGSTIQDQVRLATHDDIDELRNTAIMAKNHFDRFHSDSYFSENEIDRFMGIFIENSVKGREDYVVVPKTGLANAFFAGSKVQIDDNIAVGRMTLSAVSTDRKGWHLNVTQGLCHYFIQDQIKTAVMTTQSTNRAVLTNLMKLNFRFGRSAHVFSRVLN